MDTIKMELDLPRDVLVAASIPEKNVSIEIKKALALYLFKGEVLSFGKACELSGLSKFEFMELIGKAKLSLNYDVDDYEEDLQTIRNI